MRGDVSWAFLETGARVMHLHRHQQPWGSLVQPMGMPLFLAVVDDARLDPTTSLHLGFLEPSDSIHLQFSLRFGFGRVLALGSKRSTL